MNAHAGGITFDKDTGRFWWFGEYKTEGQEEGGGVSVYSSEDLATWESHGLALGMDVGQYFVIMGCDTDGSWFCVEPVKNHTYISPENVIQRPKVVYSDETSQYHVSEPS